MSIQLVTCSNCSTVLLNMICRISKCECGNNVIVPPQSGKVYVDLACCQKIVQAPAENEFFECVKCMQTNDIMRMKRTVNGVCIYKTIILDEELPPEAAPVTKTYPRSILKKKVPATPPKGLRVHMMIPTPGTSRDEQYSFIPDDPIDVHHNCKETEKLLKSQNKKLERNIELFSEEVEKWKSEAEQLEIYVNKKEEELERANGTIRRLTMELEKAKSLVDSTEKNLAIAKNHNHKLEAQLKKYIKVTRELKKTNSDLKAVEAVDFFESCPNKVENPGNLQTIPEVQEEGESKSVAVRRKFWRIMVLAGEVVTVFLDKAFL